jgi:hypothetical protein
MIEGEARATPGPLAQLVERLHGMEEVTGSNPVRSTNKISCFFAGYFNWLDPYRMRTLQSSVFDAQSGRFAGANFIGRVPTE